MLLLFIYLFFILTFTCTLPWMTSSWQQPSELSSMAVNKIFKVHYASGCQRLFLKWVLLLNTFTLDIFKITYFIHSLYFILGITASSLNFFCVSGNLPQHSTCTTLPHSHFTGLLPQECYSLNTFLLLLENLVIYLYKYRDVWVLCI